LNPPTPIGTISPFAIAGPVGPAGVVDHAPQRNSQASEHHNPPDRHPPHGKTTGAADLVMAIGRPAEPIEFQSIDGRPVTIIWLVSSPPDKTGPHIQALARISKLMLNDNFRQSLNVAQGPQEMFDIIVRQEALL
jgi:hypothetical protein